MRKRGDRSIVSLLRLALAGAVLAFGCAQTAAQSILPIGFFDRVPVTGAPAAIEADMLTYDGADVITASGGVVMRYAGYVLKANRLVYNQRTQALRAEGDVELRDPTGTLYVSDTMEVTGGFKEAFLTSLTLTLPDGSQIVASDADYSSELITILNDAVYSPCGLCIDEKGRRIGWQVKAARMVYNRDKGVIEMTEPRLELLGIPVAWLPWLSLPDPSQPRLTGFRLPSFDYSDDMGAAVTIPYFWAVAEDTDVIFTPRLMSRQGALFAAELVQRFDNGEVTVKVSGLYQLDKEAFAGEPGKPEAGYRDWRGAIGTTGAFTPIEDWTAGWSYTAFTDPGYLTDYKLVEGENLVNEAYVTHLSPDYFADVRVQQLNLLGFDVTDAKQALQARTIPTARGESITDLPDDWGQVRVSGTLLGVQRDADHTWKPNGVDYVYGYRETKFHGTVEASWQKQWIGPGGIVVTPFAGVRLDAANYDGASPLLPDAVSLLSATPIAALDVRWPLIATDGLSSHIFEPIAQVVYRGSETTAVGITNDNAQSFVFDDTNLFSYNRFSGTDRQETGLRANLGARYQANFADGSWIDLVAGQSFHLAGLNALAVADTSLTGVNSGLGTPASYVVAGARAGFDDFEAGGKLQLDPEGFRVVRAGLGGVYRSGTGYWGSAEYIYLAADPAAAVVEDQHELGGTVGVPLPWDYWSTTTSLAWDLTHNTWLSASAGVTYDDRFLVLGLTGTVTGETHKDPNDVRIFATFKLRTPTAEFGTGF